MTPVTLSNSALYRTGSSIRITSLDEAVEANVAVRQCAFWYPLVRDRLLELAPWGFARKSVALAAVTDVTYPGYPYVYEYPEDCVHAVAVCDAGGLRAPTFWLSSYPFAQVLSNPQVRATKVPFQIGTSADGNSNVIMTDIPSAYLYYVFRQTVTATYSALFNNAFGWELGADIAPGMQVKESRAQYARAMANQTVLTAMTQMMNEAQQDPEADSPSISCRY